MFLYSLFTLHFFGRRENFCHRWRGSPRKLWKYWSVILKVYYLLLLWRLTFNLCCIRSRLFTAFLLLDACEIKGERGESFLKQSKFTEVVIASHITYCRWWRPWKDESRCSGSERSYGKLQDATRWIWKGLIHLLILEYLLIRSILTDVLRTVLVVCINADNLATTTVSIRVSHRQRRCYFNICS